MLFVGLSVFVLNVLVGVIARFAHMGFGLWHHVLYAVTFATTILATLAGVRFGLLVTLAALAVFPRARPSSPWHPALAAVGLGGYVLAVLAHA